MHPSVSSVVSRPIRGNAGEILGRQGLGGLLETGDHLGCILVLRGARFRSQRIPPTWELPATIHQHACGRDGLWLTWDTLESSTTLQWSVYLTI